MAQMSEAPEPSAQEMGDKERQILDVGQELMQKRGYEGFSYRDIADRVGIRSASIHYYYPSKSDLVVAVARRYRQEFGASLAEIDADEGGSALERIETYAGLFQQTLGAGRVCLCGMLASGTDSLSAEANKEAQAFFVDQQRWVEQTIADGAADRSMRSVSNPKRFAATFVAALEGAMLLAHNAGRPAHLDDVVEELVDSLRVHA